MIVATPHTCDKKYKRLSMDYELRRVVMEMRSQMSGTYAPLNWSHGSSNDQPLPPPPMLPLF